MNNNDISRKAGELLKSMNSSSGVTSRDIKRILSSPQVQNFTKNLSDSDKQKLMQKFMNTSNSEIEKILKKTDLSKISIEDILKNLR